MNNLKTILKVLLAIIFIPIGACYGTSFIYVHVFGESVAMSILPQYADTVLLHTTYSHTGMYRERIDVYVSDADIQELRTWYRLFVPMSPFDEVLHDDNNYYVALNHLGINFNEVYTNLLLAANISYIIYYPNHPLYDIYPQCFDVELFTGNAIAQSEYLQELSLRTENLSKVYAVVTVCWPNYLPAQ